MFQSGGGRRKGTLDDQRRSKNGQKGNGCKVSDDDVSRAFEE